MPALDEARTGDAQSLPARVVFVSGYRRKELENYAARNTAIRACKQAQIDFLTIAFDSIPVGKYKKQPPFPEMVEQTFRTLNDNPAPTILLGHCGGGAVALEASKRMDSNLLLGLVLLCPLVAYSEYTPVLKRLGITWLRKNVFCSANYREANTNKKEYLAATHEVFQRITADDLSHIPDKKIVLIGATEDRICAARATERLACSLELTYRLIKDEHSPRREETSQELASVIKSMGWSREPG